MTTESKALRLARYLREFVGLRSSTVYDINKYEAVLWFGDMPKEPECSSPAWNDEFESGDPWLLVRKQQLPKPPVPPEIIVPWVDQLALKQATTEIPKLRSTRLEPDLEIEVGDGEDPPLVERSINDYPDVTRAYERYRPSWEAWSEEYRRRSRIQTVYAELFRLHTQVQKQGEIVELVLGLGLLAWRSPFKGKSIPILRHVITAQVDLHFDPGAGVIRLECAADGARLRIEDDMLEAELRPERSHYAAVGEQLNVIGDDIWDRASISVALKSWAASLHADSEWSADLRPAIGGDDKPVVSFAPALILRKRNQAGMVRIYDALIKQLNSGAADVPSGWGGLVEDEDDQDSSGTWATPHEASGQSSQDRQETYFPLLANREQRRIVEAINQRRGVLVQGPPGTGKSHTIANLMCHLLATGKRVLITAETGRALQVLKDKLPEEIRPLCVSLLGQGGDAFAELNSAVQGITSRFSAWTPGAYNDRISDIDQELDANRRSLAKINTELRSLREEETLPHNLMNGAYQGTASAIARKVASEWERYSWLQVPRDASGNPTLTNFDMTAWLHVLRSYDDPAIAGSCLRIVDSERLPTPADFVAIVTTEQEAKDAIDRLAGLRSHAAYGAIVALAPRERARLNEAFKEIRERRRKLNRLGYSWLPSVVTAALGGRRASWQALFDQSRELIHRIEHLLTSLGSASVLIPADREAKIVRADAAATIQHLQAGGKWTSFGLLTPKAVKDRVYLRDKVTVDGQPADIADRLHVVCIHLDLNLAFDDLKNAWADHGGLPVSSQPRIRLAAIKEQVDGLSDALDFARACLELGHNLSAVMPVVPEPDWHAGQDEQWLEIVDASAIEEQYRIAAERPATCLRELNALCHLHDAHPIIASLIHIVEQRDVTAYSRAYDQVRQVEQTRRDQRARQRTESELSAAVPGLTDAVVATINDPAWDKRFTDWEQAWRWAIADSWLRKRSDFSYQEQIWQRRHDTEKVIGHLLAESASLRAWTHFFKRLSTKEAAALKSWREAVKAIGKGTGRSAKAERLRREARQYMDQCRESIPVWIMPRYLVAEMVDPTPNRYDLIIVDEASQLGVESLFLFYIGRKMVVVGDDQQISPYGVGIADTTIADLQHHYLEGIPHRHALSAQSSLYSNAKIRFDHNIVLREHFRCMPEIIQFSNDLCYASNGTPLDPLRAYPANRLQPLALRHVPDGYRTGGAQNAINEPEADALLAQIVACIADPRYAGRSMGVISLQGEAQAKLIEHKLLGTLEPEVIEERRLICGDAYAFQGDERHVMFLSMVAAPNERIGTLAAESARQRFNVAASRAQDQLWLFYSAPLDVLSPLCMRHRLLSYMLNPRRTATLESEQDLNEFERDVYRLISERGFHVRAQVCIGDPTNHRYRIDLVVEGMQGRLAVECDGEKWHGPDRYEYDMARQRDLERAGWQFVRIRGGDFYRDRGRALEPLWAELDRLGIKPGGIDETAGQPPPPAQDWNIGSKELSEVIVDIWHPDTGDTLGPAVEDDLIGESSFMDGDDMDTTDHNPTVASSERVPVVRVGTPESVSEPHTNLPHLLGYVAYEGPAGPDPRTVSIGAVADGLCRIVEVEGPMIARRAYDVYLQGCGIKRLGGELKSTMNKALASAIRQGRVVSENEEDQSGLIFSTVRIKDSPSIKLRKRGPRTFDEIPPAELRIVGKYISENRQLEWGTDEHLRAILECFDLKRLTTQVGTSLLEILDKKFESVNDQSKI